MERRWLVVLLFCVGGSPMEGGTLSGHVRDLNWFARPTTNEAFGVGYYEYGVNGNGANLASVGGADDTDVFGGFEMAGLASGSYAVASWDVWWRSAYVFNVSVPASGVTADVDLRLKGTMWGYATFWDETGYEEFGQTFVATGPVAMIYLRAPGFSGAPQYRLTMHEGGPAGGQVGVTRTFGTGDQRLVYSYGEMPTVAGRRYYLRIRTASTGTRGVIMQMDPRPDYSDPMPGGFLWLGEGGRLTPYPERDLGVVIMSDDDGLITNMFHRQGGGSFDAASIGQTFVARGVNLISAAFWLADPTFPAYAVRVLQDGPGGAQVGTTKRGRVARAADPEMIVVWAPGECPLIPGSTYYLEVTRDGGGVFNVALVNSANPYPAGTAFRDGVAVPNTDLAGTIMEEASAGSATRPAVRITRDPTVAEAERGTNSLTIRWTTDVPADSGIEYGIENPPYTSSNYLAGLRQNHSITISNLQPHTMYHYRVTSARTDHRPGVSRDLVICTRPAASNLLVNASFEAGGGTGNTIPGWIKGGGLDLRATNGTWFFSLQPTNGAWLLQGAANGVPSDGYVYQRVSGLRPGLECTFSAWLMTAHRENNTYKYDVWQDQGRISYMRLGIDPTGGTNVNASTVQWTPRMYSHRHYTQLAKSATPQGSNITVFVTMKGQGGQWHLYAVDGCALTQELIPTQLSQPSVSNQVFRATVTSRANRTVRIEASTTLTNWALAGNVFNPTGTVSFAHPATAAQRFYRARLAP